MTKITVFINQGSYKGFECRSHSGYAQAGNDIVCAAISVLVINTINSITELTGTKMDVSISEDDAVIKASFPEKPAHDAKLLMQSMIMGISSIEEDPAYKDYVDLIIEED